MLGETFPDELNIGSFNGPYVTSWLPGETLFSICSRHHVLAANIKASQTCLQLFGHHRTGSAHDLPARINRFVERTGGRFGSASDIIQFHTILPFYLRFRSLQASADAIAAMASDTSGPLKAQLGLPAARFGAAHPLKACPRCVHDDELEHQVAYWHVEHQLPGVWICLKHGNPLLLSQLKSTGVERFGWCMPAFAQLVPCTREPLSPKGIALLHSLAVGAQAIWSLPTGLHISVSRLAGLYRAAMINQGLAASTGRIHQQAFGEAIVSTTAPLTSIWELDCLARSAGEGSSQFARLLSSTRSVSHPLRHLLLIETLFDGWDAMWTQYRAYREDTTQTPLVQQQDALPLTVAGVNYPEKRLRVLADLANGGMSMTALARRHQVSCATVMAWAAAAGISTRRRPKLLTPLRREQLLLALERGTDKADIAQSFGISVQTVTNTLRTEVGLHGRWVQKRFDRLQQAARSAWEKTAESLATPTPKSMRSLQPAVFAWLYRNDRAWLELFLTQIPRAQKSNHARIKWDQRDQALSQAIRVAALNWHNNNGGRRPTITVLGQLIPELKGRLSSLDQMPLSRTSLSEISGRKRKTDQSL